MSETVTEEAVAESVTETGRPPRADKVAIVDEIASKLGTAEAVFVSEYRGLTVGHLARLRGALRPVDAEHKVYKNTLARLAVRTAGVEGLEEFLIGPSAITFVKGDIAGAAKALRDTSRTNPLLVLKGGSLGAKLLSADDIRALADLPSRDELLAQIAGAFQAPLVKTASLLQALPRNFAYGLAALIDDRGGVPTEPEVAASEPEPEPEVAASEPEVAASEPEPELAASEPEVVASEPEPEPEVAASEPEPEVAASEPEPEAAPSEPEPEA